MSVFSHRKKVIVLGVHSFLDNHVKVGIQFIAEGLAKSGWQVDYVSIFSSPLDVIGAHRRKRLRRVWFNRQDKNGIAIAPGLTEYALRAPCPAHRHFLRYGWQEKFYDALAPDWLDNRLYDACIHDVTANVLYLKWIHSKVTVLRLNDLPEGFNHSLSGHIIRCIQNNIRSNRYSEIWSAHEPLTRYARQLNSANRVFTIGNGVDDAFLNVRPKQSLNRKSAVFIGSIEKWIDLKLIDKTAEILRDWQFDIIGPLNRSWLVRSANMQWLPPIPRARVMRVLGEYQVGMIPFREVSGRLAYVEKPLKFFEYIAAGLGVASTNVGSLKSGIGDLASYGNYPKTFADAIIREASRADNRSSQQCLEIIEPNSWSNVMNSITYRLEKMVVLSGRP
ncbi:MAG: hypothetical protein R6V60_19885 [Desulfobacterales bacterium]